jgi:hypothetical protein
MVRIKMPEKYLERPPGFLVLMEQEHLEEDVVETLLEKIPRLWQIEFEDADESDLPRELYALIECLERSLNLDFGDDEDDEDDED